MMNTNSYKWGILGCGNVTEVKSGPAYQKVSGFELTAVMRRNIAKAEDYAKRHQVPKFYGNADSLINDPNIDAIYIATPPDSHLEYALKVAKAGKICCIEKPLAPSYKECQQIVAAFKTKNIPLFVAYYRRSLPRFLKVKHLLETEKLGHIRHINWSYTRTVSPNDLLKKYNWRTDGTIAYGGYFDDLASHGLDLFAFLLGNVTVANGIATNQQNLYTAKDAIVGNWIHTSGITGNGFWNFGSHRAEDKVEIIGSKGKLLFSVFKDAPIVLQLGNTETKFEIAHPENIQFHHVENMKAHLFSNNPHPSTGETAAHTSWIMDKILGKL